VKRKASLILLCLIVMAAVACRGTNPLKNVCPIDGSPPEWTGRRNGNSCEYFHYNATEKQTHSWWAACELAAPEKPKQN
jgi:hypothetical protein